MCVSIRTDSLCEHNDVLHCLKIENVKVFRGSTRLRGSNNWGADEAACRTGNPLTELVVENWWQRSVFWWAEPCGWIRGTGGEWSKGGSHDGLKWQQQSFKVWQQSHDWLTAFVAESGWLNGEGENEMTHGQVGGGSRERGEWKDSLTCDSASWAEGRWCHESRARPRPMFETVFQHLLAPNPTTGIIFKETTEKKTWAAVAQEVERVVQNPGGHWTDSLVAPSCMSKHPCARYWTPNCSWWTDQHLAWQPPPSVYESVKYFEPSVEGCGNATKIWFIIFQLC